MKAQTQAPSLAGIAHVAIRVADLGKSREFYEKLGFEEAFAMNQGGVPTEAFLKVNDSQFIELYPQRNASDRLGFLHVCFESNTIETLNRDYRDSGLTPTPTKQAGAGNLLFTMQGPEEQNIEFTQYMPGSRHTLDRGKHLGADRISEHIAGLGIEMQDPASAAAFYEKKLSFRRIHSLVQRESSAFALPGDSGEVVEILSQSGGFGFAILFSVADPKQTAARLDALHLSFDKRKSAVSLRDPDGNRIVFVRIQK